MADGLSKANGRQNTKSKKAGSCYNRYRNEDIRIKSKAKKVLKHYNRHPSDAVALNWLKRCSPLALRSARRATGINLEV